MPIDLGRARALVRANLAKLKREHGLPHWKVTVVYGPLESSRPGTVVQGRCFADARYEHATISVDPQKVDDDREFLDLLMHELKHVVLAPLDLIWEYATAGLEGSDLARFERVYDDANERMVLALGRLAYGHREAGKAQGRAARRGRRSKAKG